MNAAEALVGMGLNGEGSVDNMNYRVWEGIAKIDFKKPFTRVEAKGNIPAYWFSRIDLAGGAFINVHVLDREKTPSTGPCIMKVRVMVKAKVVDNVRYYFLFLDCLDTEEKKANHEVQVFRSRNRNIKEGLYWTSGNPSFPSAIHVLPLQQ